MAIRDKQWHAPVRGKGQCPLVMGRATLGIEPVGMGRNVAEEMLGMGLEPRMAPRC